ncbi:MAG: hypothetical protein AB1758_03105 [Candidatus Eremiobacterota bacterium]
MRGRSAMTLAEALLGMFLMLLVVVLVFELYPMALSSVRASGQRIQAEALADSILARWMDRPFDQLVPGPATPLPDTPGRGTVFSSSVEVLLVNDPRVNPDRIRSIRVTVAWEDRGVRRQVARQRWRTHVQR